MESGLGGFVFAELPDVRMYYEEEGTGEPVILIAGVGANHRFWKGMVPLLKGYRVITLDNRGVGQTEYKGDVQIDIMADDIIHLMDYLHNCTGSCLQTKSTRYGNPAG